MELKSNQYGAKNTKHVKSERITRIGRLKFWASDRTAKIINVHYVKLHMHVKISRVNIKRMEIVYITSKPVEKGKMEWERKRTKLTQERLKQERNQKLFEWTKD